jgi:hypothetical protein
MSRASQGRGRWRGARATTVKKRWRKFSVPVMLGRREKRRRMGRGVVEDSEAGEALTRAREVVRWPSDDGKAAASEELSGGGARAQRGEEVSGDGCGEGWVRASAFYRGRREAEHRGLKGQRQCRALKASITRSEEGAFKAELEHATKLRMGRPLGLSMAREEGSTSAMA